MIIVDYSRYITGSDRGELVFISPVSPRCEVAGGGWGGTDWGTVRGEERVVSSQSSPVQCLTSIVV